MQSQKLPIYEINQLQVASFVHTAVHNISPVLFHDFFVPIHSVHSYSVRSKNNLHVFLAKITNRKLSIKIRGPSLWNDIPEIIRSSNSIHSFKKNYKKRSNYLVTINEFEN